MKDVKGVKNEWEIRADVANLHTFGWWVMLRGQCRVHFTNTIDS